MCNQLLTREILQQTRNVNLKTFLYCEECKVDTGQVSDAGQKGCRVTVETANRLRVNKVTFFQIGHMSDGF